MSIAAPHYDRFKAQIVSEGTVFTFTHDDEFLVFSVQNHEVIPFWSSRTRVLRVQALHPKYRAYQVRAMPLSEFLAWLPDLATQGIHIGTNWSGQRLIGYDVPVSELVPALEYWLAKQRRPRS